MVGQHHERHDLFKRHMQAKQVVGAQFAHAPRLKDAGDRLHTQPRYAQQHFARRAVHVYWKLLAVCNRPGKLGVHVQREHAAGCDRSAGAAVGSGCIGNDLVVCKPVKADQPVGLVQPVFAYQRWRAQWQAAGGVRNRAESRVVHPAQLVGAVKRGGGLQNRAVAGGVGTDDHLRALPAGCEPWRTGAFGRERLRQRDDAAFDLVLPRSFGVVDVHAQPRH